MMQAKELRMGNVVMWNPQLTNSNSTLSPMPLEVYSIASDKISYVFPNIENRVEPFEDDVAQLGANTKPLTELEPILLTADILLNSGCKEKGGLIRSRHFDKEDFVLVHKGDKFYLKDQPFQIPVKSIHQLQNLYYALTSNELDVKPHGQQN
jgi:hypothetical protein